MQTSALAQTPTRVFKRKQDLRRAVALDGKHLKLRQGGRVVSAEAEIQRGAEARVVLSLQLGRWRGSLRPDNRNAPCR
jgi:transposase-like protein